MIPDIWIPAMISNSDVKYAVKQIENMMKVSIMGVTVMKRKCLKIKDVITPYTRPTNIDTTPRSKNWPMITKIVLVWKVCD